MVSHCELRCLLSHYKEDGGERERDCFGGAKCWSFRTQETLAKFLVIIRFVSYTCVTVCGGVSVIREQIGAGLF